MYPTSHNPYLPHRARVDCWPGCWRMEERMSTAAWSLYVLEPPVRWKAGATVTARVGTDEPLAVPFYFDCADCGADGPVIVGVLAPAGLTSATFEDIGILADDAEGRHARPAMFCGLCTDKRTAGLIGRTVTEVNP